MRTFDYQNLLKSLFGGKVGDANVKAYEDHGKLEMLKRMHPEELAAMRKQAHFDNVEASTRIEGLYVDTVRIGDLINGAEPESDLEAQIGGYSRALRLIEDNSAETPLTTSTILAFYETLYAHRDLGRKSRYRKKDYLYVQVDGHPQAMPVSPITAFETPLVLGGACDSLADAFGVNAGNSLILNAVFTVDFLCIRPFEEGNGRLSRLFADLMLSKAGFDICRYLSIDRIIEGAAMDYYDALNNCVERWDRAQNDYTPYVVYWLQLVHEAYQQLFAKLELAYAVSSAGGKSERVRLYLRQVGTSVSKRQLVESLPDISEATIEAALGRMVKEGCAEKLGAGRSTSYRWRQ